MPPDHARLAIVFDLQAAPIASVVCDDSGDRGAPFAGWMEFTRAIEPALDADRRAPALRYYCATQPFRTTARPGRFRPG